jgi:hypothetical protein
MPTIIARKSVVKCPPKALRIFRWWGGFADESGVEEEATAWFVTNRPPPIGSIGKAIARI